MSVGVSRHKIGSVSIGVVPSASPMFELTPPRKDGVTGTTLRKYWKQQGNPLSHLMPKLLKGIRGDISVLFVQSQGALDAWAPICMIPPQALTQAWTSDATKGNAED